MPQHLDVRIDSIFDTVGGQGYMDIITDPFVETEPLLLVYSSSTKKSHHLDFETIHVSPPSTHILNKRNNDIEEEEEESNIILPQDDVGRARSKKKRHRNPCRRRPLYVNFDEINYDTWIIAPRGYEVRIYEVVRCRGR